MIWLGAFGTYVGLTEETAEALSDAKVEEYTRGSKALFAAWLCYATLIWSLKTVRYTCFFVFQSLLSLIAALIDRSMLLSSPDD